jgi:hypothetical protein
VTPPVEWKPAQVRAVPGGHSFADREHE